MLIISRLQSENIKKLSQTLVNIEKLNIRNILYFLKFQNRNSYQVFSITFITFIGGGFSLITGIIAAGYFGIGKELDYYYAALTIPTLFMNLLGVDYFGTNFFPIYSRVRVQSGKEEANKLANSIINSIAIIVLVVMTILNLFAFFFHKLILTGLDSEMINGIVVLFRIILAIVIIQIPITFISYMLQYENKLVLSQIYLLASPAITLLVFILLKGTVGIKSLAIGTVAGSALSLMFMILMTEGYRFKPVILFKDIHFRKLVSASIIMSISGMIGRSTNLIERYFSSFFPLGSISSLSLANNVVTLFSYITTPFTTVMYAKMTRADSNKDDESSALIWQRYLIFAFAIMIPLSMLIIYLREDIIHFLFQRKNFNSAMTSQVALAFAGYTGVMLFGGIGGMITRLYYLKNRIKIPAILTVFGTGVYFIILFISTKVWGFLGLSLGTSIYYVLSGLLLLVFSKRILSRINIKYLFKGIFFILASSLAGIMVTVIISEYVTFSPGLFRIIAVSVITIVIYVSISLLTNKRFVREIIPWMR